MATETADLKTIDDIIKKYYTFTKDDDDREYRTDIIELISHFNKRIAKKIITDKRSNLLTPCLIKHDVKFVKDTGKLNDSKSKRHGVYMGIKRNTTEIPESQIELPEPQVPTPPVIVINPTIPEKFKSIDEIIKKYYTITCSDKDREYMDDIIILIGHINKPLSDKIKNTHKSSDLTKYLELIGIKYDKNKYKFNDQQSGKLGAYMGIKRNEIEIAEQPTEMRIQRIERAYISDVAINPEINKPEIIN